MKTLRRIAGFFLLLVSLSSLAPGIITRRSYDIQDRDSPNERPTKAHLLGTDDLGRDRFARLIYGMRTSVLLAPAAAILAVCIATLAGALAAFCTPLRRPILFLVDILLSTPLFFLLLIARSLLPLDSPATASIAVTFAMLGLLGWPAAVRVLSGASQALVESGFVLQARANGISRARILCHQIVPNLVPIVWTQVCVLVPVFMLAEANLSVLGLGVTEPLPSIGNLMSELLNYSAVLEQPSLLAPAALLAAITASLHLLTVKVSGSCRS